MICLICLLKSKYLSIVDSFWNVERILILGPFKLYFSSMLTSYSMYIQQMMHKLRKHCCCCDCVRHLPGEGGVVSSDGSFIIIVHFCLIILIYRFETLFPIGSFIRPHTMDLPNFEISQRFCKNVNIEKHPSYIYIYTYY